MTSHRPSGLNATHAFAAPAALSGNCAQEPARGPIPDPDLGAESTTGGDPPVVGAQGHRIDARMIPESLSLGGAVDLDDENLPARVIADRQQGPVAAQARMIGIGAAVPVQDARRAGLEKAGRPCRAGTDRPATNAGGAIRDQSCRPEGGRGRLRLRRGASGRLLGRRPDPINGRRLNRPRPGGDHRD